MNWQCLITASGSDLLTLHALLINLLAFVVLCGWTKLHAIFCLKMYRTKSTEKLDLHLFMLLWK